MGKEIEMFGRKSTEEERISENLRFRYRRNRPDMGDLECEETIIADKKEYERVRNSVMRNLRTKYGRKVADRALCRVNKRLSEGYFKINHAESDKSLGKYPAYDNASIY